MRHDYRTLVVVLGMASTREKEAPSKGAIDGKKKKKKKKKKSWTREVIAKGEDVKV